ncbi:hypothetical protein [Ammonifex thiophilus]|uniref:Uncharacterized protein n=1 Tax=Ammonifex thiophilus TaxID=444093 RepID=A0A3D8P1X7_9THEO|nr:hypothetical protein [Ammonifex thiophilus]RDV82073.1 hypothetical protein DXX99_08470 [Ammonifex thiophilus]
MPRRALTRTEKVLLVVVLLAAGIFLYVRYLYDPLARQYEQDRARLQELRREVAAAQPPAAGPLQRQVEDLRQELKRKEQERDAARSAKAEQLSELTRGVTEINALALAHQLEIKEVSLKAERKAKADAPPEKPEEAFSWKEYHMVVWGRTQDVADFTRTLGQRKYLVYLEGLEAKPEKKEDPRLQARLKILF